MWCNECRHGLGGGNVDMVGVLDTVSTVMGWSAR